MIGKAQFLPAVPATDPAFSKKLPAPAEELRPRILLTAAEAYPELERAFLTAETRISAGFRVFDLRTRLRSDEALQIGRTWFDLVRHTLARGVRIRMVLSDFDPIARTRLHRGTWRAVRMFLAAAEVSGRPEGLEIIPAVHSATAGSVPRTALWPVAWTRVFLTTRWLSRLMPPVRVAALRDMPGLACLIAGDPASGQLRPRFHGLRRIFPATHHQKLAVFDGKRLYIGGLDLHERFYDTPRHEQRGAATWHDVQLMLEGPVAADAERHLEQFLGQIAGRVPLDAPAPARGKLRFLRTLSRQRPKRLRDSLTISPAPGCHEIEELHHAAIAKAEDFIYMESQYFRDRRLARRLAARARANPALQMILILPAAPDDVAFERATGVDARLGEFLQLRALRILRRGFGPRLFVGVPVQPRPTVLRGRAQRGGAPLIYVHAKVSVFDETLAIVSSANMNGRSLRWDTEAGVALSDRADVRALRERLMRHWLPEGPPDAMLDPRRAVSSWRQLALENEQRAPPDRKGFVMAYDMKAAALFARSYPVLPEDLV